MMKVKNEVKRFGITGTGASGFKRRMLSTFSALRGVTSGPDLHRPPAQWRSRKPDPFKEHAASVQAGHEIELWHSNVRPRTWLVEFKTARQEAPGTLTE